MSIRPHKLNGTQLAAHSQNKVFLTMRIQKGDSFGRKSNAAGFGSWVPGVCDGCGEAVWVSETGRRWNGVVRCWECG